MSLKREETGSWRRGLLTSPGAWREPEHLGPGPPNTSARKQYQGKALLLALPSNWLAPVWDRMLAWIRDGSLQVGLENPLELQLLSFPHISDPLEKTDALEGRVNPCWGSSSHQALSKNRMELPKQESYPPPLTSGWGGPSSPKLDAPLVWSTVLLLFFHFNIVCQTLCFVWHPPNNHYWPLSLVGLLQAFYMFDWIVLAI